MAGCLTDAIRVLQIRQANPNASTATQRFYFPLGKVARF